MKYPGSKKRGREANAISLPALYPAIFSICGLPMPERFSNEKNDLQASPIVSEQYLYEQGTHRVLYDGNYKYFTYEKKRNSELYDIKNDPQENKRNQVGVSFSIHTATTLSQRSLCRVPLQLQGLNPQWVIQALRPLRSQARALPWVRKDLHHYCS